MKHVQRKTRLKAKTTLKGRGCRPHPKGQRRYGLKQNERRRGPGRRHRH